MALVRASRISAASRFQPPASFLRGEPKRRGADGASGRADVTASPRSDFQDAMVQFYERGGEDGGGDWWESACRYGGYAAVLAGISLGAYFVHRT